MKGQRSTTAGLELKFAWEDTGYEKRIWVLHGSCYDSTKIDLWDFDLNAVDGHSKSVRARKVQGNEVQ